MMMMMMILVFVIMIILDDDDYFSQTAVHRDYGRSGGDEARAVLQDQRLLQ